MSPPIMSRFDLFFIILDECDETTDFNIGRHIINFHRFRQEGVKPDYSPAQMKRYIQYAKSLKPQVIYSFVF